MFSLLLLGLAASLVSGESPRWVFPQARTQEIVRGRRRGPCGDGDRTGPKTVIAPGPLTLKWEEPVNNKGSQFRIALSKNGVDEFEECILVNNIPHNDNANPRYDEDDSFTEYSLTVDIPDVDCSDCTLQLVNIVPDGPCNYDPDETENELDSRCSMNYHSCANVEITGTGYERDSYVCSTADWAFTDDNMYSYKKKSAVWLNTFLMDKSVPASFRNIVPKDRYDEGRIVAVVNSQFDDAQESLATDKVQRANAMIEFSNKFVIGLRFKDIPLPAEKEILDARLVLWMGGNGAGGNNTDPKVSPVEGMNTFTIDFELAADSKPIEATEQDLTKRQMTSEENAVTGHILNSQAGRWSSQNLKGALQEVLDKTDWASGNALMVLLDVEQEGSNQMMTYESDRPAELIITYRSPVRAGETDPPTAMPTAKPEQPCTYAFRDRVRGNYLGRGDWYPARIDKVHENANDIKDACTYDLVYDDGDTEQGVTNKDLEPETEQTREAFQLRELVDINVNGEFKRGQVRILQRNSKYTVEGEDGEIYVDVDQEDIRQWVHWFVGDRIEIKQCWWFKADIIKVVPDGRYVCRMDDNYTANVPYSDIREIVEERYKSGETVNLFYEGEWVEGFIIKPDENTNLYMVGVSGTPTILRDWPASKIAKKEGGGR